MLSLYLMKTVVVIIDRLVCEPTWTLIEVPVSQKSLCQSYSIDFLWNHDVHTRKECILLKKLELLHNLWSFVIERSPGRQIFMVSFWFQGELVFHAPGDRASYQLFQTFFESLNHSGKENIAFFWKWQEIYLSIALHTHILFIVLSVHVPLKVTGWSTRKFALFTLEGFLSGMLAIVYFQIKSSSARITTLLTLETFFSWMC